MGRGLGGDGLARLTGQRGGLRGKQGHGAHPVTWAYLQCGGSYNFV